MKKLIALIGEYNPKFQPHISTDLAIEHSRSLLNFDVEGVWTSTQDIDENLFQKFSAIWVAPGSPYKNIEKTLWAIKQARENLVPCL